MECNPSSRTSSMYGPRSSHPLENPHSQADSFLIAARLIRNGWTDEGKKTGVQLSNSDYLVVQRYPSKPDGNPESTPKASSIRLVVNSRKTDEESENTNEKTANEAKQTCNGAFVANKQSRERQMTQAGIISVKVSGCRTTCRQSRKFKAPLLPVIAEM